jgi:hypothetical protein
MNPFTLISTKKVYENPWISVREDSVIRPGWKDWIFGIVTMNNGCSVLAIDDDSNIFITTEYHYGISDYSVELISWWINPWESPLDCAKRELEEEAGIVASEWIDLWYIDPFTTVVNSKNYLFLARKLKNTKSNPDEWEVVNLSKLSYEDALRKALNSEITHWASVVSILKAEKYIHNA